MGTSGNRDCQRASMSALKDFTAYALTISAGNLFHNGTAQMVWSDKNFVQGEKNTGGNCRKGSFQVKQHPTGFIGSTDDIIFSTEPGV